MIKIADEFPGENEILISEDTVRDFQAHVEIKGRNNRVVIGRPNICKGLYVEVNGGASVEVGEACIFHDQHIRLFAPGRVSVGPGCAFNGHSVIHMHESANVSIGKNCLIAGAVSFSTSHVHKIIDVASGERLNPAGDIVVDDHVWISSEASLWPGAKVGHDSVVGKSTYISKAFPANCIIAGTPARVIREGVTWDF